MNDKDWLDKVSTAFKEYERRFGPQNQAASFVEWLYTQYGVVLPKDKK